jgi:hypothetical protein
MRGSRFVGEFSIAITTVRGFGRVAWQPVRWPSAAVNKIKARRNLTLPPLLFCIVIPQGSAVAVVLAFALACFTPSS